MGQKFSKKRVNFQSKNSHNSHFHQKLVYAQNKLARANNRASILIDYLKEIFTNEIPFNNALEYEEYRTKLLRLYSNMAVTYSGTMSDIEIIKKYVPKENKQFFQEWIDKTSQLINENILGDILVFMNVNRMLSLYQITNADSLFDETISTFAWFTEINQISFESQFYVTLLNALGCIENRNYCEFHHFEHQILESFYTIKYQSIIKSPTRVVSFQNGIDKIIHMFYEDTQKRYMLVQELINLLSMEYVPSKEEFEAIQKEYYQKTASSLAIRGQMFSKIDTYKRYDIANEYKNEFDRLVAEIKFYGEFLENFYLFSLAIGFNAIDYDSFVLMFEQKKALNKP